MPIEIFRVHADQIRKAAADTHPHECCGLLLGRENRIVEVVPSPNVAPDPARRFEVDPAILLATHRHARATGLTLLGSYHSHPSGDLTPSPNDARQATDSMPLWLLTSHTALQAWQWLPCAMFVKMDLLILP